MFRIKICGITNIEDAMTAADAGADAIGLNFYRASPRFIDTPSARAIIDAVRGRVRAVGVFVDAKPEEIRSIATDLALDLVQLSGNDSPEWLATRLKPILGGVPVMQALRVGSQGVAAVRAHIDECRQRRCLPQLVLWDAYDATQFGGTGRTADWDTAAACVASGDFPPLVLAGGLRPANVADAIQTVRPAAVDTASGVESSPGRKDAALIESFVRAAKAAFDNLPSSV